MPSVIAILTGSLEYITQQSLDNSDPNKLAVAHCPAGKKVTGGGVSVSPQTLELAVIRSEPTSDHGGWLWPSRRSESVRRELARHIDSHLRTVGTSSALRPSRRPPWDGGLGRARRPPIQVVSTAGFAHFRITVPSGWSRWQVTSAAENIAGGVTIALPVSARLALRPRFVRPRNDPQLSSGIQFPGCVFNSARRLACTLRAPDHCSS